MSTIRVVNIQHSDATEPNIVLNADGTATFVSGITISGGTNLTVSGTAEFASGTVSAPGITFIDDNNTGIYEPAADTVAITTATTERLRIDSAGNVGIGTESPSTILHCSATDAALTLQGTRGTGASATISTGGANSQNLVITASTDLYYRGASQLFQNVAGTTEYGRWDSSGRLLVGTTTEGQPDADNFTVEDSGNCGISIRSGTTSNGNIFFADATSGTAEYRGAIRYYHNDDALTFYSSSSERMRIDSSGRLLVGTSSERTVEYTPGAAGTPKFQVEGNDGGSSQILITDTRFDGRHPQLAFAKTRNGAIVASDDLLGSIGFFGDDGTDTRTWGGRITCEVDGTPGANDMPGRLVFSTTDDGASSPTERMRITSQGYLKASNTGSYVTPTSGSSATQHEITNSADARDIIQLYQTHGSNPYGIFQRFLFATPNNATNYFHYCMDNTAARVVLRSNGGIANFQSNNVNLCDEREKKNIETLDSTWDCLKHWELKKFHYNEDADTDDKRYGVIAQQVEQYCPEVITDWTKQKAEDAVFDEDGNVVTPAKEEITRMGVKEQQMMWMAIKALQEAQTRIETLEAEVAALKGA